MAKWWRNQSRANEQFNNRTVLSRLPVIKPRPSNKLMVMLMESGNDYNFPGNTVRDHNGKKI